EERQTEGHNLDRLAHRPLAPHVESRNRNGEFGPFAGVTAWSNPVSSARSAFARSSAGITDAAGTNRRIVTSAPVLRFVRTAAADRRAHTSRTAAHRRPPPGTQRRARHRGSPPRLPGPR